jgi:multidrug transporter EmrE-like cation transporter
MSGGSLGLLVLSVLLSTAAQLMLKVGMSKDGMLAATAGGPLAMGLAAATSPWILGGMFSYVSSAFVWLKVLSKVDVSQAYPCVALGFVLTALGGMFLLGEPLHPARAVGLLIILLGVGIVALN